MPDWIEDGKIKFVNPYNFVSLGGEVERKEVAKGNLTGVISCTITTKTPLAIPDSETKVLKEASNGRKEHPHYEFFKIKGVPVIPGSEIRGVIRSAFETLTNSCMSVCNSNILSARHSFPRNAGLIRKVNGNWELYRAKKYMLNTDSRNPEHGTRYDIVKPTDGKWYIKSTQYPSAKLYTGTCVNFSQGQPYEKEDRNGKKHKIGDVVQSLNGSKKGYLLLWEYIREGQRGGKHHNSIFEFIDNKISCSNIVKAVDNFNISMKLYIKNDPKYESVGYSLKENGDFTPVWYELVGETVYLSPACISRTVFDNRLEDLIGSHKKCGGKNLCPTCNLFGMIGNDASFGSSLRFSDAVFYGGYDDFSIKNQTLKELAGPKTTSVEFYTEPPSDDALTWNYDYQTTEYSGYGRDSTPERNLIQTQIRGRKFYLHNLKPNVHLTAEKTKRNSTMELANKNKQFKFDIFFENISSDELQKLVWTLNMGENNTDGVLCHKLGHGKPIGLGSVKITVDEVKQRKLSFDGEKIAYNYIPCEISSNNPFNKNDWSIKEFLAIANLDSMNNKNVCYPLADDGKNSRNNTAGHQWFAANRQISAENSFKPYIAYTLPSILGNDGKINEDIELPKLVKNNAFNARNR